MITSVETSIGQTDKAQHIEAVAATGRRDYAVMELLEYLDGLKERRSDQLADVPFSSTVEVAGLSAYTLRWVFDQVLISLRDKEYLQAQSIAVMMTDEEKQDEENKIESKFAPMPGFELAFWQRLRAILASANWADFKISQAMAAATKNPEV